jgi:hypothetical protein
MFTVAQLDLFPVKPVVERLAPKAVAGAGTGVVAVLRVRLAPRTPPHLVFLDRHGWYCESHGISCPAVGPAREMFEAKRGKGRKTASDNSASRAP